MAEPSFQRRFESPIVQEAPEAYLRTLLQRHEGLIISTHEKTAALMKREAIDPREFGDVLQPEEIEADLRHTSEIQARISAEKETLLEKLAASTEALLYRQSAVPIWR